MKKTYNKLDSELLLVETEGGFLAASAKIARKVTVQDYEDYSFGTKGQGQVNEDGSWDISFD